MSAPEQLRLDDADVRELVRVKARTLVGRAGIHPQDVDDVEQELLLRLARPLSQFDPAQSPRPAYLRMVVPHAAANVLRDRRTQRARAQRAPAPLLNPTLAAGPHDDRGNDLGLLAAERRLDAEALVAGLPASDRALLADVLCRGLAAAARARGVAPPTLRARYNRLLARLRAKLFSADPELIWNARRRRGRGPCT